MHSPKTPKLGKFLICLSLAFSLIATTASAAVSVPSIFSDHMVLQRDLENPVWGKADPGESVTVEIAEQSHSATADTDGKWTVSLDPLPAGGPHELVIRAENTLTFKDVLIGDVWFCSGQSNMQWNTNRANHADLEIASANYPQIRFISVPRNGSQEPLDDFNGEWAVCSPDSVPLFSAVGYFFGRRIHQITGVPIGLVDNSWGGSAVEAWISRESLASVDEFAEIYERHEKRIEGYTDEVHAKKVAEYEAEVAEWEKTKEGSKPRAPRDPRYDNQGLANIYNGVVHPTLGYGLKGVIWYQGESNAGRAEEYQKLFPHMITMMREDWGQGDFPFYWVQLADFTSEQTKPSEGGWAYLREAQTMTLDAVPNGGQAVIIDAGEGRDIHPRDKQTVANRLARIALARDYGYDMSYQSPRFVEMTTEGENVLLTFSPVSSEGLYAFDTREVKGFAIAGEDQQFVWAKAEIVGKNQVRVWSDAVPNPVAVRYAWASNPVCNLFDRNGLPVTPFRTDDW